MARHRIDMDAIRRACEDIADRFQPDRIVLFGSYASASPSPDSDVDLLVVVPFDGSPQEQSIAIREHLNRNGVRFPMDVLARTPEYVQYRLTNEDWFMREIMEKGKVMYEAPHARVGREG